MTNLSNIEDILDIKYYLIILFIYLTLTYMVIYFNWTLMNEIIFVIHHFIVLLFPICIIFSGICQNTLKTVVHCN